MINILFTCAGRRNYLINYFKEALDGAGSVVATDALSTAPALIDADYSEVVPEVYDPNYIDCLIEIVKRYKIVAIISLNDLELPILSKERERFEAIGTRVLVAHSNEIDIAFDKWKTTQFINSIGLNSPKTYLSIKDFKKAQESGEIDFPVVLKPRFGSASVGIEYPESIRELELSYVLSELKIKRSILKRTISKGLEHSLIIQEKMEGKEYGMDIVNDLDGNYVASFARKKLAMRSGETDKALSVVGQEFETVGKIIGNRFGHLGSMDCDLFLNNEKLYVLEINPRFGGGYPFTHESGANIAGMYISWLKGNKNIDQFNQYKKGQCYSKCDRMIKISDK